MKRSIVEHPCEIRPLRAGSVLLAVVAALLPASPPITAAEPPVDRITVAPGGVVRWPGVDISTCAANGAAWRPLGEACWYPVDLLTEPGSIELVRVRDGERESLTVEVTPYPYPVQRLTVAPAMVDPPPEQAERIRREGRRVGSVWHLGGPPRFGLPLAAPLVPLPEARSFGALRVFNGEPRSPHGGVDLSAAIGTPVMAAAAGTVVIADSHYFSGNSVFIDHGDDLVTMYFHLDVITAAEGDLVRAGDVIGTVGSTGRVTGPHLHFGVRWHGARIDPMVLLADRPEPVTLKRE